MTGKLVSLVSASMAITMFSCVESRAQWPLGKDITPGTQKPGESSGYLTGSGKFQVFVSPNIKGHTFMLDAETGRLWIFKKDGASGEMSLQKIPVDKLYESDSQKVDRQKN